MEPVPDVDRGTAAGGPELLALLHTIWLGVAGHLLIAAAAALYWLVFSGRGLP